jgi:hypothetical protein
MLKPPVIVTHVIECVPKNCALVLCRKTNVRCLDCMFYNNVEHANEFSAFVIHVFYEVNVPCLRATSQHAPCTNIAEANR